MPGPCQARASAPTRECTGRVFSPLASLNEPPDKLPRRPPNEKAADTLSSVSAAFLWRWALNDQFTRPMTPSASQSIFCMTVSDITPPS